MNDFENIPINKIAYISYMDTFDLNLLITLFCDHIYIYIYDSSDRLYGIITAGDFKKYSAQDEYINTNFLFITECQSNLNQDLDRIIEKKKTIQEIPVLDIEGKLLYVKKRSKHMINCFNFEWILCNKKIINEFFKGYNRICYLNESEKLHGLQNVIGSSLKMEQLNNIKECTSVDVLITHNECLEKNISSYNIDELYLTLISRTVIHNFSMKGISYFFFQTPVEWKCRKENLIFYPKSIDSLAADTTALINIFGNDADAIKYWTEHDYKKIDFCEVNGRYLLDNTCSTSYNVVNNYRVTLNQPTRYLHTIYILGTCIARGYGVSDSLTIPSLLQMKLNEEGLTKYRVVNLGTGGGLNLYSDIRDFVNISKTNVKENDIVVHLGYNCWELKSSKVEFNNYYELSWIFNRKQSNRCFINAAPHLTAYGNKIVSEYVFSKIKKILIE